MNRNHLIVLYSLLILCWALLIFNLVKTNSQEHAAAVSSPKLSRLSTQLDSVQVFPLPDSLTFAGEIVPLDIEDVRERLDREIHVNAYWQSNMILLMKRSRKFLPQIEEILKENGVPEDFKYLAMAESALMNVASPAGARGFWQFMPDTGKEYGLEISNDVDERYHLEKSTLAATKYLNKAHQKFGDWTSVAASYNMGQSGFSRRQRDQLSQNYYDLYLNEETSRYMFRILAFKVIFEKPERYGFFLNEEDYYTLPEMREITVREDIKDLATWAKQYDANYKLLKLYNPWLRDKNLNVKKGRTYTIQLPL
ncbi:lytic transglycosylase domain-containing protein [Algoriphagus namhaensis]